MATYSIVTAETCEMLVHGSHFQVSLRALINRKLNDEPGPCPTHPPTTHHHQRHRDHRAICSNLMALPLTSSQAITRNSKGPDKPGDSDLQYYESNLVGSKSSHGHGPRLKEYIQYNTTTTVSNSVTRNRALHSSFFKAEGQINPARPELSF